MKRWRYLWIALATTGLWASHALYESTSLMAQAPTTSVKSEVSPLPISRVVLFSSGVGFFQREGDVNDTQKIDLSFPTGNINDLLKSMVLQDLGGGQISAVNYDSSDPIDKTLKSFAIDLTNNPSLGELLKQARGEKIEMVLPPSSGKPGTFSGTIIGIEKKKIPTQEKDKDAIIEVEYVNLFTSNGIQSLPLNQIDSIRFLNAAMDQELKRALETLAQSHDTRKKSVSLNFQGKGKRPVAVSYVIEHPIWKTSYRLVIDKEGKPFLQGWALVENPTDEDWNNVKVTLVSGRPISFRMDLYQPLYVGRPLVEPELFASLRPPTYSGAMDAKDKANITRNLAPSRRGGPQMGGGGGGAGLAAPGAAGKSVVPMESESGMADSLGRMRTKELLDRDSGVNTIELGQGVMSAATATEMGDFFQYAISQPVNIGRQKSAMLPIINQNIEGSKISIYNQAVHAKYPLLGLRLKNNSGLHLMQGPITVFEGNSYSGDTRIMDLVPNEERLVSYAIDLSTEVEPVYTGTPDQISAIKIVKGVMQVTSKARMTHSYNVKNRDEKKRSIVIEHPFRPDWQLVTPNKANERSRDVYRFERSVDGGRTTKLEVIEEQERQNYIAISDLQDDQTVRFYLSQSAMTPKVREALTRAIELRSALASVQRQRAELEQQLTSIREDQTRLRANMREVPNTSAAYKRYLEKFDKQETEIERLQEQIKASRIEEASKRKEFESFLMNLNVE